GLRRCAALGWLRGRGVTFGDWRAGGRPQAAGRETRAWWWSLTRLRRANLLFRAPGKGWR
ncbi:hypothetical protein, partial [Streptomyces hydrogenans]